MGFMSRRVLPVCGHMCICCPALRSRSRQPVKRYKKLLAEIFPKSIVSSDFCACVRIIGALSSVLRFYVLNVLSFLELAEHIVKGDAPPNERKIVKLCEYAAKNPFRIPKIAKYLEQRIYKELRSSHIKFVNIIMEAYNRLFSMCREQMAYFAVNILNVVVELLDDGKQETVRILGCQTLTKFIYCQTDGTYAHNIENLVNHVCMMARKTGEEQSKSRLRASSLQCISAMVWFMSEYSYIFADLDKIVDAAVDNYEPDEDIVDDERGLSHHNWVNEVVRSEAKPGAGDVSPSYMAARPRPEKKDPSFLTREEVETPAIWAQICIQKIVELAKESTTMCQVLDPMFNYFDIGRHWVPRQGLALAVLSDMSYFAENSGKEQLILSAVIRHLDYKKIAHDPQVKSEILMVATALAQQIRSRAVVTEIGILSDLCRHLRKSFQATVENAGQQELDLNISLQNSIEDCLVEIVKGVSDVQILFDIMAITMEKLPPGGVVARAIVGTVLVLAHIISSSSFPSHLQKIFPEALLVQILNVMMHPDAETRILAHQIFTVLLIPASKPHRNGLNLLRSGYLYEPKRLQSKAASALSSATALLDKLRRDKDGEVAQRHVNDSQNDCGGKEPEEEFKQGRSRKNSPNFYSLASIIDRTAGSVISLNTIWCDRYFIFIMVSPHASNKFNESESLIVSLLMEKSFLQSLLQEPNVVKLSEDQISQLLSAIWIESSFPDNMPSNFEAIAHSFSLTVISSRLRNSNQSSSVRFFQLPLSLRNMSMDHNYGTLPPSCLRSLLTLATGMMMFVAKIYNVPALLDFLKSSVPSDVDPYLGICDDLQVYVKPQANISEFGSASDQQAALYALSDLRVTVHESERAVLEILVKCLLSVIGLEPDELAKQLSEAFMPEDALLFGPQSRHELEYVRTGSLSQESFSFDGDVPTNSILEDDAASEFSAADQSHFMPKMPSPPSPTQIISVGQLLQSALEVAGQVAGASVSTSPLSYSTMARQCEALGTDTRKKLSSWLARESGDPIASQELLITVSGIELSNFGQMSSSAEPPKEATFSSDPWMAMKLPPASPFDNFLKAAGC
ncbi:hypothetical protein Sjap_006953 [Stephania japonica]|uniref:ARM repeat superfamily protein n=1 Tax=Stephania japonica TaxID=461633 RepID=A0AAP0K813_9MAGN